jgi:hypothetical protein
VAGTWKGDAHWVGWTIGVCFLGSAMCRTLRNVYWIDLPLRRRETNGNPSPRGRYLPSRRRSMNRRKGVIVRPASGLHPEVA